MAQYRIVKNVGTNFPDQGGAGNSLNAILRRCHSFWVSIRIIASFKALAISMFVRHQKSCGNYRG